MAHPECPVERAAEVISGKWTLLIIRDLADGGRRFTELQRSLSGISPKTLSERLRELERRGVIDRRTFHAMPPRVEYELTQKGQALLSVIDCLRRYGEEWLSVPLTHTSDRGAAL